MLLSCEVLGQSSCIKAHISLFLFPNWSSLGKILLTDAAVACVPVEHIKEQILEASCPGDSFAGHLGFRQPSTTTPSVTSGHCLHLIDSQVINSPSSWADLFLYPILQCISTVKHHSLHFTNNRNGWERIFKSLPKEQSAIAGPGPDIHFNYSQVYSSI